MREQAAQRGLAPTVMTFHPHPRAFFAERGQRPELIPTQISSLRDKLCDLAAHGACQIVLKRFNQALADMSAEDFIEQLLVRGLAARWLLVGEDFRFGHKRSGDIDLLRKAGRTLGFDVETVADVEDHTDTASPVPNCALLWPLGNCNTPSTFWGIPTAFQATSYTARNSAAVSATQRSILCRPRAALCGRACTRCAHTAGAYAAQWRSQLGVRPTVTEAGRLLLETHLFDCRIDAYVNS